MIYFGENVLLRSKINQKKLNENFSSIDPQGQESKAHRLWKWLMDNGPKTREEIYSFDRSYSTVLAKYWRNGLIKQNGELYSAVPNYKFVDVRQIEDKNTELDRLFQNLKEQETNLVNGRIEEYNEYQEAVQERASIKSDLLSKLKVVSKRISSCIDTLEKIIPESDRIHIPNLELGYVSETLAYVSNTFMSLSRNILLFEEDNYEEDFIDNWILMIRDSIHTLNSVKRTLSSDAERIRLRNSYDSDVTQLMIDDRFNLSDKLSRLLEDCEVIEKAFSSLVLIADRLNANKLPSKPPYPYVSINYNKLLEKAHNDNEYKLYKNKIDALEADLFAKIERETIKLNVNFTNVL